jgi:putative SOS response-associated peptidase YedK
MPGRLFLTTPLEALCRRFGATSDLPPQPPRLNIAPGQEVLVLTPERRLELMRWGIVPVGRVNARGRPVMETIVNARSETVFAKSAYVGVGRGVIPVGGWYEWTGERRRKQPWRIASADGAPLAFAAITDVWTAPDGRTLPQVAPVTCAPNADVARIHDRMGVLLDLDGIGRWLSSEPAEAAELAVPWPEGRLVIGKADDVDWTGA